MRKIFQVLLGTVMVAAALVSCKENELEQETLEVSPSSVLWFSAKGNEAKVLTISTNASTYEVDAEEWVIMQKDGNKLSVNVRDNESAERSCDMTISAGTAEPVVIKITQGAGEADAISVDPTSLLFRASGNEPQTLTVTTNVEDWTYDLTFGENEEEGWFTAQKEGTTLTISVEVNDSESERSGKVTVSAGNAEPVEIPVTQTGKPVPVDGKLADKTSTEDPVRVAMEQGATKYTVTPVVELDAALEDAGNITLYYEEAGVGTWNLSGTPVCTELPEGSYTLPEEGFTIPAGQTAVQLPIEINLESLESETSYMLVLKIQSKSENIGDVSCGNDGLRYIITTAKKPVGHSTRKKAPCSSTVLSSSLPTSSTMPMEIMWSSTIILTCRHCLMAMILISSLCRMPASKSISAYSATIPRLGSATFFRQRRNFLQPMWQLL